MSERDLVFFILFLSVPILEIYIFLKVSEHVGPLETVCLIVLTAIVGSILIKREGIKTIHRIRTIPLNNLDHLLKALGDGFFVVISGILLLTPGFITDFLGLALFFSKPRHLITSFFIKRINFSSHLNFNHDDSERN